MSGPPPLSPMEDQYELHVEGGGGDKKSKLSKGSVQLNWNFEREERVGNGSKNKNLHGRGILHFETTLE